MPVSVAFCVSVGWWGMVPHPSISVFFLPSSLFTCSLLFCWGPTVGGPQWFRGSETWDSWLPHDCLDILINHQRHFTFKLLSQFITAGLTQHFTLLKLIKWAPFSWLITVQRANWKCYDVIFCIYFYDWFYFFRSGDAVLPCIFLWIVRQILHVLQLSISFLHSSQT